MTDDDFSKLKIDNHFDKTFVQYGSIQCGIIGKTKDLRREIGYLKNLQLGELLFSESEVKSRGSGLIGTKVLSNYIVTINWSNLELMFEPQKSKVNNSGTYGFNIGISRSDSVYIQSIIQSSAAENSGLRPSMKILSIDAIDLTTSQGFCKYIYMDSLQNSSIDMSYLGLNNHIHHITILKQSLQ